ncbi:MAG: tetratricopeptide (TPR) repeat protein [Alteromonadaceae bacterium]|jgi:tetratricopeptide (TPR) repeat protein
MQSFKQYLSALAFFTCLLGPLIYSASASALTPEEIEKRKEAKTRIPSPSVGKKVQKAFELYGQEDVNGALETLLDISSSKSYDKAFLNKFIGNIYATIEGKSSEAIKFLNLAVQDDALNYKEQGDVLRLLAQLYMMEKQYQNGIDKYQEWMSFTGEQDAKVYIRIANGYYELKQLDKVIEPSDKSIALAEKLEVTPYILKLASYFERKDYKNTVKMGETLVRLFPEEKRYWSQLGMFYVLVEDYKKALSTMEMAYKQGYLDKANEFKTLAQMYSQLEVPHKAAIIQEKYIKLGVMKRNEQTTKRLANYWLAAKEMVKAAKYFGEAAAFENDAKLYRRQGEMLFQADKYAQSVTALKKALDIGVDKKGPVTLTLMQAYFYQGKYKQAYATLLDAEKITSAKKQAKSWKQYIKDKAKRNGVTL